MECAQIIPFDAIKIASNTWRSWRTGRRWECNMRMQYHCDKKRIPFDASVTKSWDSCLGDPPPNEPYNFLCEMAPYVEIRYAYSGGARGVPAQKFGLFVTAGCRTCGKVCRSIACPYSTSHTHAPKKQKNDNKRCSDSDYNQSHARS